MANIIPLSELANNASHISKLCHTNGEPVFLTKDGYGDMVVLSMEQYELLNAQSQAYLANMKTNAAQTVTVPKESEPEDDADKASQGRILKAGIEKIPLEDVIDILEEALKLQQSKDTTNKKRFP